MIAKRKQMTTKRVAAIWMWDDSSAHQDVIAEAGKKVQGRNVLEQEPTGFLVELGVKFKRKKSVKKMP